MVLQCIHFVLKLAVKENSMLDVSISKSQLSQLLAKKNRNLLVKVK